MSNSIPTSVLEKFTTFGDLLRYLRRRTGLTQIEMSIAVGYSDAQISRLEQNLRLPDVATIAARFVPVLDLNDEPIVVAQLLQLATHMQREDAPASGLCPYKGLNYFDETDADLFVGREALTDKLAQRFLSHPSSGSLHEERFLAVVGASGSGKSSLVRAGLVPALHWNQASADWSIHIFTPGAHPLESLAECLLQQNKSAEASATLIGDLTRDTHSLHLFNKRSIQSENTARVLLVIDQFEELFALCRSETERTLFIDNLLISASELDGPTAVIITLRADFYAHCAAYVQLREALAHHQEYIGPMNEEELRRAIEEPARHGHWELEPGLVDLLLHDAGAGHEPGALPLLSHALLETWQRRRGRTLTLSGYTSSGGVRGAIAETAESVFTDQLTNTQQAIARRIFIRLTELGDEMLTGDTRRRATFNELILKPEEAATTQAVLKSLADARLITTSEDSVEVAHEALIREWPTLRGWLEDNRESLRLQRQFTDAAQEWEMREREPDMLYRGARLAQLREWAQSHADEMNPLEHEFLNASVESNEREALEREAQRQRELDAAKKLAETEQRRAEEQTHSVKNLRTRNRVIAAIGLAAIVLAVLASIFGLQSNQNANSAQVNAEQAVDAKATAQTESLIRATAESHAIQSAAQSFSRELAVQSELNLNIDTQRSILLALAGLDKVYTHEAENALHKAVQASRELMTINTQHTGQVYNLAFSPDGKRLVSSSENSKVWDAATGKELFSFPGFLLVFSPDGTLLANAEGIDQIVRVSILDAQTGQKLLTLKDVARSDWLSMNFSPDEQLMLGETGKIKFFDSTTGQLNSTLSSPDWTYKGLDGGPDLPLRVNFALFSADGKRLAIDLVSDGNRNLGRVEVWDYPSRQRLLTLPENFDVWANPQGFAFSPDGKYIVAVQKDGGPARVWDATTGKKLYQLSSTSYFNSFAFTPDGKYILTASADGSAQMWDAASGKLMLTLNAHRGALFQVSVSPGCVSPPAAAIEWCGLRLATAGADETIKIWDISPGGGELLTLPGSNFFVNKTWSRVTTIVKLPLNQGGYQGIVQSWDLPALTSASIDKLQVSNYLSSIVQVNSASLGLRIIQSAKLLTSTFVDTDEFFKIWDVSSGEAKEMMTACCASVTDKVDGKWVQGQDVSPDGKLLIIGYIQGNIDVFDLRTGKKINTFAVSKLGDLWSETLSPDGSTLAVATTDNLQIWDMATGTLSNTWPAPQANIMAFTPDGKSLLIGTCLGTVNVLDVTSGENKFTLSGFTSCVNSFGFSHDGSRVAIGSESGPLKVWDWNTHEELLQLPFGNASTNIRMQFSPDDTRLMVSAFDADAVVQNTVRIYVLPTKDIIALAKSRLTRTLTLEECQQYLHMDACPASP